MELTAANLVKRYAVGKGVGRGPRVITAVDDVSLHVSSGERVALVGESGCGKSTLGRLLVGLEPLTSGHVTINGVPRVPQRRDTRSRAKQIQMIFQHADQALDPRMRIGASVEEPLRVQGVASTAARRERVLELMRQVGLDDSLLERLPHQCSGGQRQRVAIARALALEPECLVCDEPVSAVDVSVQAQLLNVFRRLNDTLGVAYVFITHDLRVVRWIAQRIIVMYMGRIVESALTEELFSAPQHPYTQALLAALPEYAGRYQPALGEIPSAFRLLSGCRFHTRCPVAEPRCRTEEPTLRSTGPSHQVSCHLA